MSGRKLRSDSAAAQVMAAKAAQTQILPPEKLSKVELQYWNQIINSRAGDSWTPNDLIQAMNLAKLYVEIDKRQKEVEKVGRYFIGANGEPKLHPLHKIIEDLNARSLSMCRSLQIHSRATNGESRDQIKKNKLYSDTKKFIEDDDGLLARIN
ncbi:hypothetical protein [Testudinibacter sp. TR-2022]|uniref:hypothetical protein n=1 Tax=Testudinibacter sp. TR-2022 TaxID=2585029 RepID=UPI00111A7F11|nr:hypothetical protein [Testudinibacter sp. TR-2022]TNH06639.1 hypothetical protein FHQ30_07270 [Pasteurellaceae bacterium Phil11]TNH25524.1 hypothetical protein FHQ29_01255 [Testudinibacter sp. TR-2022]TNH25698.1 hypothetical protein FHQ27_08840 [Testudinibacter sp. TR-2022]